MSVPIARLLEALGLRRSPTSVLPPPAAVLPVTHPLRVGPDGLTNEDRIALRRLQDEQAAHAAQLVPPPTLSRYVAEDEAAPAIIRQVVTKAMRYKAQWLAQKYPGELKGVSQELVAAAARKEPGATDVLVDACLEQGLSIRDLYTRAEIAEESTRAQQRYEASLVDASLVDDDDEYVDEED